MDAANEADEAGRNGDRSTDAEGAERPLAGGDDPAAGERGDARAAGLPVPGFETLQAKFGEAWDPRNYVDQEAASHYERRTEPLLRRFYERELHSPTEAIALEQRFEFELDSGPGEAGQSVVVACRGGLGRTATVVACLLRDAGLEYQAAIDLTRNRPRHH